MIMIMIMNMIMTMIMIMIMIVMMVMVIIIVVVVAVVVTILVCYCYESYYMHKLKHVETPVMNIFEGICSDQSCVIFQLGKATDDGIAIEFSPRASTWILVT